MKKNITAQALIEELLHAKELVKQNVLNPQLQIDVATNNSQNTSAHSVFFAYQGVYADSHQFLEKASGLLVLEDPSYISRLPKTSNWILVKSSRKSWSICCSLQHGNPEKRLKIIGVTGTNGKSSCVEIIYDLLHQHNIPVCSIGTLGVRMGDKYYATEHTTPDPPQLFDVFAKALKNGVEWIVMEVSSHSIVQQKIAPLQFELYLFTSFSQDHLDFHNSMEEYFDAKCQPIFHQIKNTGKVVISSKVGNNASLKKLEKTDYLLLRETECLSPGKVNAKIWTGKSGEIEYSLQQESDEPKSTLAGFGEAKLTTPFLAPYLNENLALSICGLLSLNLIELEQLKIYLPKIKQIKGRFEVISKSPLIIIDYAHTPDALENLFDAAMSASNAPIACVFGCGGNRDREKRAMMGSVSSKYCSTIILTDDNPRDEPSKKIADDILVGIANRDRVHVYLDRDKAIRFAILTYSSTHTVIIAGKGHEMYQERCGVKYPFSDQEHALKAINELKSH